MTSYKDDLVEYALQTCRLCDFDLRGPVFAAILSFGNYSLALADEVS